MNPKLRIKMKILPVQFIKVKVSSSIYMYFYLLSIFMYYDVIITFVTFIYYLIIF